MSKWKLMHQPCPSCTSTDAYCIDHEDNGYCFSCKYYSSSGSPKTQEPLTVTQSTLIVGGSHKHLEERGITKEVCEFFDVKVTEDRYVFPYYDEEDKLVAQKTRLKTLDDKGKKVFPWVGDAKGAVLFGANKFKSGNSITITEGEFDALAFRQMSGDYPVVSVKNGAQGAAKDIKNNLEYFKAFNKVYICFDADEAGRAAAEQVAELFPIGKAKVVNLRHYKDANEYLMAGKVKEFTKCWWDAKDYTPAGIESAANGGFDSLFDDIDNLELYPYPYDKLNETTFGIRKGEMVTVVAGSGVGKSAFVSEVEYQLLMKTNKKVGILHLEESPKKSKMRFMSLFLNKPLHLTLLGRVAEKFDFLSGVLDRIFGSADDWRWTPEVRDDLEDAWKQVIERKAHDGDNQLWLFNHFGSNSIDSIVSKIDAMVTGLGCEFIFLDHISIVVSDQQNADERKALDELATKLRTLVEHRNFALVIVSHLRRPGGKPHEEGGETSLADIRGTAGIGQLSDIVIGLERNGQHTDEYLRNVTKIRVLKNRFSGFTGLTSYCHYDVTNGRLLEVDAAMVEDMEKNAKLPDQKDTPIFDDSDFGIQENLRVV